MVLDQLSNAQLAQVFNAVTGQTVSKFTDKATGLRRTRSVLEQTNSDLVDVLGLAGLGHLAPAAPAVPEPEEPAPATEPAVGALHTDQFGFTRRKLGPRKAKGERKAGGKLAIVLNLLRSNDGTTVPEIMEATGWLPHTTRAYLSKGGAPAKAGHTIVSAKVERDGKKVTIYSLWQEARK